MAEFTFTGIPEGYEPIDKDINKSTREAKYLEYYLATNEFSCGDVIQWASQYESNNKYLILKAVEKPKQYRPFENHMEAELLWDAKLRLRDDKKGIFRIIGMGGGSVLIGLSFYTYGDAFHKYECVDGTPFGVEVTE